MAVRAPIISVLGHVDHGKSSLLDALRGSNVVKGEAGGITQAIGASIMPLDVIQKRCGELIKKLNMSIKIPGVLFIDTPGHAAFTSLRKRGGSLADIAILTVDINDGFMPQTKEAIDILKSSKTPFVIAANKVDLIPGFKKINNNFLQTFNKQSDEVKTTIETKLYELVGTLHDDFNLQSERYDRVDDYTKQVAIVPCSALEHVGLEELLMIITGMTQKYLEKNLNLDVSGPGKGVILEVKETLGLGQTFDVILYNGTFRAGDEVLVGTLNGPEKAKIKALLMPDPLMDMRDKKSKYKTVKQVHAATGVKLNFSQAPDAIAGMPILGFENEDEAREEIVSQINEASIDTDKKGIIIKADTIGSLEAMVMLLREKNIPIRKASIGNITKKDISDAESNFETDPAQSVILGFNIKEEESTDKVKVIVKDIIYALVDEYDEWQEEIRAKLEAKELDKIPRPFKLELLQNCMFRQSNPCIAGFEVLSGDVRVGINFMDKHGNKISHVKSIQADKESVSIAHKGRQVALSLPGATGGRHLFEGELYYSDINEKDFRHLKKLKKYLREDEKDVLKEIAEIKRKNNSLWGI